jgi:hypothetical protein
MEDAVASFFSGSVPIGHALSQSAFPAPIPHLYIVSQKTHSEEVISKNGIQKNVHMVVKNSPFHIVVQMSNGSIDFNRVAFDSSLVYDCEGLKEVDFVKAKPVEFKPTPNENGTQLDCELRIKVLSSHHEDQLFKIKIQGFHPISKEEIPGLVLYTFPIKVISKPEQLKKRAPSKKRTLTDMIVDTISRIEKKQEEQQKMIERMLQQQAIAAANLQQLGPQHLPQSQESSKRQRTEEVAFWDAITSDANSCNNKEEKKGETADFEETFIGLIRAYQTMKDEEKPETIRRVIRNSSTRDTERVSELLDLFWTEGLLKERSFSGRQPGTICTQSGGGLGGNSNSNSEGCNCIDCPHKQELERVDEFYKEFLNSGVNFPGF